MTVVTTKVGKVSLFRNGAEIVRSGSAELPAGTQTVVIRGLSGSAALDSVRLSVSEGVRCEDLRFEAAETGGQKESEAIAEEIAAAEKQAEIRALQADHTVVFSSHILSEVQQLCSRVIILDKGRMVRDFDRNEPETGTLRIRLKIAGGEDAVMARLQHLDADIRAELLPGEENGVTEARLVMETGGDAGAATDRVFRMLAGAGIPVRMMKEEKETLEEVFLRETDKNNE